MDLIGWIILYWMGHIVSAGSYFIGWIVSGNTGFYALAGYWMDLTERTDGLDGALVGRKWDGTTLAGAITGAPPLAIEGRQAVGSGGWHQFCWCYKGAEYLFRSRKINTNRLHKNWN